MADLVDHPPFALHESVSTEAHRIVVYEAPVPSLKVLFVVKLSDAVSVSVSESSDEIGMTVTDSVTEPPVPVQVMLKVVV